MEGVDRGDGLEKITEVRNHQTGICYGNLKEFVDPARHRKKFKFSATGIFFEGNCTAACPEP